MNFTKIILNITNKLRPFLLKVFPYELLRKLKGIMINKSYKKLKNIKRKKFKRNKYKDGVNVIGNIKAATGLGQSCRLIANELEASNFDFSLWHYNQLGVDRKEDNSWDYKISKNLPYNINLIHINPHELGIAYEQLDNSMWDYRYNIGFWLWELEEFPNKWLPCFNCVDEIWTPSKFTSNSIRKKTNKPVYTIPYCVNANINKEYDREFFGLPKDRFLFLMMYDHSSTIERKNPISVLKAFKKAFKKDDNNIGLVIKINNCRKEDKKIINDILKGYKNLYFITESLDRDQVNSLTKCVDVFVSLHRAEGFGLVLAEAMLLGTPTIATNWSANIEFMNNKVSCLVDYDLVTIKKDIALFKKGNRWAEPNIKQAAWYMIKLYKDKKYYDKISNNAKEYINKKLSLETSAALINKRIKEIYKDNIKH